MRKLIAQISRRAIRCLDLAVSETGVGKEVIATAIHEGSPRRDALRNCDCGALTEPDRERALRHEKARSPGPTNTSAPSNVPTGNALPRRDRRASSDAANSLLGALERRNSGASAEKTIDVNVRVVCATHQDLRSAVNAGRSGRTSTIASRSSSSDSAASRADRHIRCSPSTSSAGGLLGDVREVIPANAMDALLRHRWPGNLRELRNFVEAALAMGEPPNLALHSVEGEASAGGAGNFPSVPLSALVRSPYKDARSLVVDEFEVYYLEKLLERCAFNVSRAARESGISRAYLSEMLKRHRLRGKDRLVDDP